MLIGVRSMGTKIFFYFELMYLNKTNLKITKYVAKSELKLNFGEKTRIFCFL